MQGMLKSTAVALLLLVAGCGGSSGSGGFDEPAPATEFAQIAGTWETPPDLVQAQAVGNIDVRIVLTESGYLLLDQLPPAAPDLTTESLRLFGDLQLDAGALTGTPHFVVQTFFTGNTVDRGIAVLSANAMGTEAISDSIELGGETYDFYVEFVSPLEPGGELSRFDGRWYIYEPYLSFQGSDFAFDLTLDAYDQPGVPYALGAGTIADTCQISALHLSPFSAETFAVRAQLHVDDDIGCQGLAGMYEGYAISITLPFGTPPARTLSVIAGDGTNVLVLSGRHSDTLPPPP